MMNSTTKSALALSGIILASAFLYGCGSAPQKTAEKPAQPAAAELTISAAVSLKDALSDIQKNYQTKHPNVKLVFNLGASGSLQKQIEQGAPADVFISAAPKQMNELQEKNLIDKATLKNLVENKLVVVVPNNTSLSIAAYDDLAGENVKRIAIGEPKVVPAGQYAAEALNKLSLWEKVQDKIVYAKDVRTVLTYAETGNVDAGIVYKTDAASSNKVKIAATAPAGSHQPIIYPAAVIATTKNPQEAAAFLAYLVEPESRAVFEKYGFTMISQ